MRTFKEDYETGIASEETIKPILEHFLNQSLIKTPTHFPMDYASKTAFIEIKTRTYSSTFFETTLLPYSKIQFAKATKRNIFFVFVFTDGIYYIKYDNRFDTFDTQIFQRPSRQDHTDRPQRYILIPTSSLLKMEPPTQKESV